MAMEHSNKYIPYRTTLNAGDVLRNPFSVAGYLAGSMLNFFWSRHELLTGYTQQNYQTASIVSIQHFSRPDLRKPIVTTVSQDNTSNKPMVGIRPIV